MSIDTKFNALIELLLRYKIGMLLKIILPEQKARNFILIYIGNNYENLGTHADNP